MKQYKADNELQQALTQLGQLYDAPTDYQLEYAHPVGLDRRPVWWLRFERVDERNLGLEGEHFTALIDLHSHRLMGLTHLNHNLRCRESPDKEASAAFTRDFMNLHAPDIADQVSIKWIQPLAEQAENPPHDSALYFYDREAKAKQVLLGTRVKMVDEKTGLYAWVVVTSTGDILNFERDVHWSTLRGRRTTEVWLHDAYPAHPGRKAIPTNSAQLMRRLRG